MPDTYQIALEALRNSLGDRETPAGIPATRYKPSYGRGPSLEILEKPNPLNSLRRLFKTPFNIPPEVFKPVNSGGYHDLISHMNEQHPDAMNRTRQITLRPLPEGVLGDVYGQSAFRVDPERVATDPDYKPLDVLRHEVAHMVGYPDDERQGLVVKPRSAQDVDEASRAIRQR